MELPHKLPAHGRIRIFNDAGAVGYRHILVLDKIHCDYPYATTKHTIEPTHRDNPAIQLNQ
jgi:hypothetical protein